MLVPILLLVHTSDRARPGVALGSVFVNLFAVENKCKLRFMVLRVIFSYT